MAEDAGRRFVKFTRGAAERTARAVIGFERMSQPTQPLASEHYDPARSVFRMGTFTGQWAVDTFRVVTLKGSTFTVSVLNEFGTIGSSGATTKCGIAREGSTWCVIQAKCP